MEIKLNPLVYIRQPEYWGIEVVGCLPEVRLPVLTSSAPTVPKPSQSAKLGAVN
jgi:hypothetical protein